MLTVLVAVTVAAMSFLIAVPLVAQVVTSLRGAYLPFGLPNTEWTLEDYVAVYALFGDFIGVIGATASFVLGSMVVSLAIGGTCAWLAGKACPQCRQKRALS